MKKVIIFNPIVTAGGISKIVSDYIRNFSTNIKADILCLDITNNIYYNDITNNVYVVGKSKNIIKRIYKEYKILKNGEYDIIHINGDFGNRVIECIVAKLAGIKRIIIHSHSTGSLKNSKKRIIFHKVLRKMFDYFATDYFSCSEEAAKWMFSKKIIKKKKYKIIKNGICIDKFKFDNNKRYEIRKKINAENKYVIGFVGRLVYEKNPLFLIDIFNECKKKRENCLLIVIGDGILETEVKEKVEKMKLDNDVLFLGNLNNADEYYNAMDCFVLPSKYEGLGIVNIEAQCSGLKTLCSSNVAKEAKVSDLITFISLEDKNKWVNEILKQQNINRENAYKSIMENNYDIESVVSDLEKIYQCE